MGEAQGNKTKAAEAEAQVYAARAARAVHEEPLRLYWQLGRDILDRQGAGLGERASRLGYADRALGEGGVRDARPRSETINIKPLKSFAFYNQAVRRSRRSWSQFGPRN